MKNPLKTLYFDLSLVNLLRDQPALILKLAQQNRKFLQVVAHPDKMGAASTDYSAELNNAVDMLKDREQLEYWIEEYLREISNVDQIKRELVVQRSTVRNLTERVRRLEYEKEELFCKIKRLENEIIAFDKKFQDQAMHWLMYRRPFTKIMVPDTRFFVPEIQNIMIEVGDEYSFSLYFMFDWQTIRIWEGRRKDMEKQLARMQQKFREKGILPGRKLSLQYVAGCIGTQPICEARISARQAYCEVINISPFLEIGKNLVTCSLFWKKRDKEPMVLFTRQGKITDLRKFSFE